MISLAIAAMLLTAAGAAFNASSMAIEENEKFFRVSQAARISMSRMLTQCRRGTVLTTSTSDSLNFNTHDMKEISYMYDATNKQLLYVTNNITTDPDYVLARDVTACSFQYVAGTNPATGAPCVARMAITLTITKGSNSITLTGSAAPRAMLAF